MIEILNPSNNTDIISNIQNLNINSDKEKEQVQKNINNNLNNNWWYPSKNGKKRILWAGTHIHQSNGYSRVMYYITKYLGAYDDIELTIYGFQSKSDIFKK